MALASPTHGYASHVAIIGFVKRMSSVSLENSLTMQVRHESSDESASTRGRWAFWSAAVLAAMLHWIPHFPPQIDLAQHAAQIRMLHDWNQADFPYRAILQLNFFTPYLPAYLLGTALAFIVPTVTATKIIWSLGAIGTVYASVRLRIRLGGDPVWDWLLLPGLFGITFIWGLLTFQLAVPLGLFSLEYWIVYLRAPTIRRGAGFGFTLCLLFFCHSLVTAWLMAVCGLMLLTDKAFWSVRKSRTFVVGLPLLAPVPVVAIWLALVRHVPQVQSKTYWGTIGERTIGFCDQWIGAIGISTLAASAVGGALLLSPFLAGARLQRDIVYRAPLVITLAVIMLAPEFVIGNAFTSSRFMVLLGPSLVIALSRRATLSRRETRSRVLMPGIAIGCILLASARMVAFDREQRAFLGVANVMLPNRHTLAVIEDASSIAMQHPQTYLHFGSWYQVVKGGLAEFSFAAFLPTIVHFRASYAGIVPESFALRPTTDYVRRRAREFDYILVRTGSADSPPLQNLPAKMLAHDGQWWLFEPVPAR